MEKKWKLVHKKNYHLIENKGGSTLGYSPGAGIRILEDQGYAFKDFNDNGKIDDFEDWRLPLLHRVKNFAKAYHLDQNDNGLYHCGHPIKMQDEIELSNMFEELISYNLSKDYPSFINMDQSDHQYMIDHYLLVILVMMMDNKHGFATHDYHVQVFLQGIQMNMMDHIIYSLNVSLKEYLRKMLGNTNMKLQVQ